MARKTKKNLVREEYNDLTRAERAELKRVAVKYAPRGLTGKLVIHMNRGEPLTVHSTGTVTEE